MNEDIRNIGIFAHVDAGKTTLTEQMLLHSGFIRTAGRVDEGTAHTDDLPVERRRGISVKATGVSFKWNSVRINLIDTPGHTDFSSEIERSMWALDGAVLVVDACEGIQPQTEILFETLKTRRLPFLFFINKIDRTGADKEETLEKIRMRLTKDAFWLDDSEAKTEFVCGNDDALAEKWLNGETIEEKLIDGKLKELVKNGLAHPALAGSGLKNMGVAALLDAVAAFLPPPEIKNELCGVAYAVCRDKTMGRGLWVRLFGGSLQNREAIDLPMGTDALTGEKKLAQRKITRLRALDGSDIDVLSAGDVGQVYGLGDTEIGYVFGNSDLLAIGTEPGTLRAPLITVKVLPESPDKLEETRKALYELASEDPLLGAEYIKTTGELRIHVMGRVQLEIVSELVLARFGLKISFGAPEVIYKETIASPAEGFVAYTMPKPCWAIMRFLIEPAPRGSGVTFESKVQLRDILLRYQNQVRQALPIALAQGRRGWQVTDVKITLIEGNYHQWHTHPLDFVVATPMGIQDGLKNGGSKLLEPILKVRFSLPQECMGRVMTDVNKMRGEVTYTKGEGDTVALTALIPVSTSMDYSTELAQITSGRGAMTASLEGYRECPEGEEHVLPRKGTDPLDTAKYILAARSALEGDIFEF